MQICLAWSGNKANLSVLSIFWTKNVGFGNFFLTKTYKLAVFRKFYCITFDLIPKTKFLYPF